MTTSELLLRLYDAFNARDIDAVGVAPGLGERAPAPAQVEQLVELDADRLQALAVGSEAVVLGVPRGLRLVRAQRPLLLLERVDAGLDLVVVHRAASCLVEGDAASHRRHGPAGQAARWVLSG
jgi:hypothetical protein